MHLAGHFIAAVLEQQTRSGARVPRGCIGVRAGTMQLTVCGDGERVRLEPRLLPAARAVVSGSLDAFLGVALGGSVVVPLLTRRVRISGDPRALLPWLPLLRRPARRGPVPDERSA